MTEWVKATMIKTVKTMAETALGVIGASVMITDVNWMMVGSAVLLSGVTTILFNIANLEVE